MKKLVKLLYLLLFAIMMMQCREEEEIVPDADNTSLATDTLTLTNSTNQSFSLIGEKEHVTAQGYEMKGSLYLETDSGSFAFIQNAQLSVRQDLNGNMIAIEGSGPFQMPELGMFESFNFDNLVDASFVYNTGQYFKEQNDKFKELPLRDTSHYFFFNLLNLTNGGDESLSVKNAQIGITSWFINLPHEEIIIPTGTFEFNTPVGPVSVGNDLAIGISAQKSFPFTPQQYTDSTLNAVITQQSAFSELKGFLFLAGEMSLGKKIPMKLSGQAVIDGDMNVVFSEGFASSSFSLAMNGNLLFGHDLLDLLPLDFEARLTNVTLRFDESKNGNQSNKMLKFAGGFDDNAWMETVLDAIAGTNISQYVPFTGNEGNMFASFGEDWEFYVNTYFAINTPHLGKQPTREGTLRITEEQLSISAGMAIPFVPGEVTASGTFGYDGNIHLQAKSSGNLEIHDFNLASNLTFDIYNDRAALKGNVTVPYGMGLVNVNGEVSGDGLSFTGNAGTRPLKFGPQITLPVASIKVDAKINASDPFLKFSGLMHFPQMDDELVEVSGGIGAKGIEFTGAINTNINIRKDFQITSLPLMNGSITARTWEGVFFEGNTTLPFGIADATVKGHLTPKKDIFGLPEMMFNFKFNSNPTLKIDGFSFPTAKIKMQASTVEGLSFNGQIRLGSYFGYVASSGYITGKKINFTSKYQNYLRFGNRNLYSNLTISAGSHRYPNIGSVSGVVQTPFGNVNASGVIGLNGKFAFSGSIAGCNTVSNPFYTFSAKHYKNFSFSQSGVGLSASGYLCDKSCNEATNCEGISVGTDVNWGESKFNVCIDFPVFGRKCF